MVIKKMNSVFHKHSRWLFGAFTVIIIVSFLGFLTPGSFGISGLGSPKDAEFGIAYGKKVTYDDLFQVMRALAVFNQNVDEKAAFSAICLRAKADQIGVAVSDAELKDLLQKQFQTDGKYDRAKYREFVEVMRKRGFSEEELFEGFRLMALADKLRGAIAGTVVVTDSEAKKAYRELNTRYAGKAYILKPQESAAAIPTPELQKFFDQHASNYEIDGSLVALVIEFPYANYTAAAKKQEKDAAKVADKAKILAKDAAEKFSDDVYDALKTMPVKDQQAAFKKLAAARKFAVKEHKITFNSRNVGNLKQLDYALLKAAEPVEISMPVQEEKAAIVGFVTSRVAPRPAQFAEVTKQVFKDCKTMRTLVATEAKAKEFAQKYNACKDAAARAALLKTMPVAKTADFSLTGMENFKDQSQSKLLAAASGIAPDQAAAAGDTLIVLAKREVPQGAIPAESLDQCRFLVRMNKQQLALFGLQEDISNHCQYRDPRSDAAKK